MKSAQLFYAAAFAAPVLALYAFMHMTDETADATLKIDLNSPNA
jgi:phytoene/squalene synthetase